MLEAKVGTTVAFPLSLMHPGWCQGPSHVLIPSLSLSLKLPGEDLAPSVLSLSMTIPGRVGAYVLCLSLLLFQTWAIAMLLLSLRLPGQGIAATFLNQNSP